MTLHFTPPVIAHRGASAYAPENTLIAFVKALQLGCQWVECDVMQARDGTPVIFHDETLSRTTNGTGRLSQYTFDALRTLDAGRWFDLRFAGEPIPSLNQLVGFLQHHALCVNLELKPDVGHEKELARSVAAHVLPHLSRERILFSSFSKVALQHLRTFAPHAQIGLLLETWEPDWQESVRTLECVSVHVNHDILDRESAGAIKALHKKLLCYTVNDPSLARELFSLGVDAVFSDRPDVMMGDHHTKRKGSCIT